MKALKTDKEKNGLVGPVQKIHVAYEAGRLIEATSYSGVDNLFGKTEYSYDERQVDRRILL